MLLKLPRLERIRKTLRRRKRTLTMRTKRAKKRKKKRRRKKKMMMTTITRGKQPLKEQKQKPPKRRVRMMQKTTNMGTRTTTMRRIMVTRKVKVVQMETMKMDKLLILTLLSILNSRKSMHSCGRLVRRCPKLSVAGNG